MAIFVQVFIQNHHFFQILRGVKNNYTVMIPKNCKQYHKGLHVQHIRIKKKKNGFIF